MARLTADDLRAECQLEPTVLVSGVHAVIRAVAHETNRDHQAVATDLGNERESWVQRQAQELKCSALWQVLLKLAPACNDLLWRTGFAQQFEQQGYGVSQWCKR